MSSAVMNEGGAEQRRCFSGHGSLLQHQAYGVFRQLLGWGQVISPNNQTGSFLIDYGHSDAVKILVLPTMPYPRK